MASFAIHLLRETKGSFDVIVIEAQMPDMDSYEFVRLVTQEIKIPVIMMGVDDDITSARMKAIEKGACEYWLKPLNVNHINNMWQHVVTIQEHDQILRILEVKTGQKIMRRDESASATKETNACVLEKHSDDNYHYQLPTKKNRLSWSPELHEKFLRAVNQLGMDSKIFCQIFLFSLFLYFINSLDLTFFLSYFSEAKPRKIVELMNVPGLTRAHISSHWQVCFCY
jgi:two-component response regulator (ARR-B family)